MVSASGELARFCSFIDRSVVTIQFETIRSRFDCAFERSRSHKRVYRLYLEEGLSLRNKRPKRHVSTVHRAPREIVTKLNEVWGMDFVSDELFNGRRIRALPIIDLCSRECLALYAAHNIRGDDVVSVLNSIAETRGRPQMLRCDNGPEFISKVLDRWAYENGVKLDFSRRGKPTDNAFVESFNGRLRDECLNAHHFVTLEDASEKLSAWRWEYKERRPHSALDYQTPLAFAAAMRFIGNDCPRKVAISQLTSRPKADTRSHLTRRILRGFRSPLTAGQNRQKAH